MSQKSDDEERTRNLLLYQIPETDQEMQNSPLPGWLVVLIGLAVALVVGVLVYACVFHPN